MFGWDDAIGIGASLLSGMGNKKQGAETQQQSGFAALPQEVKDIWLKSYIPSVQAQFDTPYQPAPMKRYEENPSSPFYSQGMADLQAYSDTKGGLFTTPTPTTAKPDDAATLKTSMDALRAEMLGRAAADKQVGTGFNKIDTSKFSPEDFQVFGRLSPALNDSRAAAAAVKNPDFYTTALGGADKKALNPALARYFGGM